MGWRNVSYRNSIPSRSSSPTASGSAKAGDTFPRPNSKPSSAGAKHDTELELRAITELTEDVDRALDILQEIAEGQNDPIRARHYRRVLSDLERLQDGVGKLEEYLNL